MEPSVEGLRSCLLKGGLAALRSDTLDGAEWVFNVAKEVARIQKRKYVGVYSCPKDLNARSWP